MRKNRTIITLGAIVALLPILGFPRTWEAVFQVLAGLSIVLLYVWAAMDRKMMMRVKAQRRQAHKKKLAELSTGVETESSDQSPVEEGEPQV